MCFVMINRGYAGASLQNQKKRHLLADFSKTILKNLSRGALDGEFCASGFYIRLKLCFSKFVVSDLYNFNENLRIKLISCKILNSHYGLIAKMKKKF